MKVQVVRDDLEISGSAPRGHEDQWEYKEVKRNGRMVNLPFWKQGAIIDLKDSWRLVTMGVAIPADDEARIAAGMTPDMIRLAMRAQDKVSLGIHPTDYEKFDAGEIAGYNPDGSYKPGPNWNANQPANETEDEDDK